ncbi:MAG TPA: cation-translocating P-type ATPase, partial [Clostridia bacterium]|nr:cation-translocating P-type ATPase [Clostridia bacterium]
MGKIAGLMEAVDQEETPLQKRLDQLGKWLVFSCLLICALVVTTGILRGEPVYQMFLAGVSLAVAAIPEGLPAIVTVALAVGVQKMVKRQSIIRKLPAVETLGCATVICSDKTGTLTRNEMTVRQIYCEGSLFQVAGEGYEPKGELIRDGKKIPWPKEGALSSLLQASALCNNAFLKRNGQDIGGLFRSRKAVSWEINGDPTDGALLVLAGKANYWREVLERTQPRLLEIPFESQRKLMTVVVGSKSCCYAFVKGAPDVLFQLCTRVEMKGRTIPLSEDWKKVLEQENEKMGAQALRVLGVAFRQLPPGLSQSELQEQAEKDLTFLGLVGMIDPPRPEAIKAIRVCREGGIKPVMITGDHQITARAIAREMGFPLPQNSILTGTELDFLTDNQLAARVEQVSVYARVSPQHKLRIVKALKEKGHVVAMTGDGVNDAPALKEADIGVAMGGTGTEVTKEASDMVLADDNFATIIAAVEEGRAIYDNIRKFIRYLLSCNVGEVLTMFLASLVGLPLPLLPMQILWVNLVTDGLPAMALGVDNPDPDLMERRPRAPGESIFAHGLSKRIINRGMQIGLGTILVFSLAYYFSDGDLVLSRTMAFTTLVFSQLFHVFECKSERHSLFKVGVFSNPYLVVAVVISTLMQLAAIYLPPLQSLFKTVSLSGFHWGIILAVAGGRTLVSAIDYYIMSPLNRRILYLRH